MKRHIHCLICSEPYEYEEGYWDEPPTEYICNACAQSFPADYLLYRLNCRKNNIHTKDFDVLEWRLTWGQNSPIDFKTNQEIFQWN